MLTPKDRRHLDKLTKKLVQDADDSFWDFVFEVSALLIVFGPMEALLARTEFANDRGLRILHILGWGCPVLGLLLLWGAYRAKRAKE